MGLYIWSDHAGPLITGQKDPSLTHASWRHAALAANQKQPQNFNWLFSFLLSRSRDRESQPLSPLLLTEIKASSVLSTTMGTRFSLVQRGKL